MSNLGKPLDGATLEISVIVTLKENCNFPMNAFYVLLLLTYEQQTQITVNLINIIYLMLLFTIIAIEAQSGHNLTGPNLTGPSERKRTLKYD